MKKVLMAFAVLMLAGCARPYGPGFIYSDPVVRPDPSKKQTQLKVMRIKQFIGSFGVSSLCEFDVSIDGKLIAELHQNQYVTAYIDVGLHKLTVTNACRTMYTGRSETQEVLADGAPQEFSIKVGAFNQLLLWRTQ